MKKKQKRIILLLVEGWTDETALLFISTNFSEQYGIKIDIQSGDITSGTKDNKPVAARIGAVVNKYIKTHHLQKDDIIFVAQITDSDGVFIKDELVDVENISDEQMLIPGERILVKTMIKQEHIIERNHFKSRNLDLLINKKTIKDIQYRIYYVSVNLEHCLHNNPNVSSPEVKRRLAVEFQKNTMTIHRFVGFSKAPKLLRKVLTKNHGKR